MNEIPIPAPIPERKIPVTAADALAMWDAGEAVPAIEVESEGTTQQEIYQYAFELIRGYDGVKLPESGSESLSRREIDVAYSIAAVAVSKGWAAMLRQHQHESIARIELKNPNPKTPDPALAHHTAVGEGTLVTHQQAFKIVDGQPVFDNATQIDEAEIPADSNSQDPAPEDPAPEKEG